MLATRMAAAGMLLTMVLAPAAFVPTPLATTVPSPWPAWFVPCWARPLVGAADVLVVVPALVGALVLMLVPRTLVPLAVPSLRTLAAVAGVAGLAAPLAHDRRLQPYQWELSWMLVFASSLVLPPHFPDVAAYAPARLIVGGVYFASGVSKLNPGFAGAFAYIIAPTVDASAALSPTLHAFLVGLFDTLGPAFGTLLEILGGLVLMLVAVGPFAFIGPDAAAPRAVLVWAARAVAVVLVAMHGLIMSSLLLAGWNSVVVPWNLAHVGLLAELFIRWDRGGSSAEAVGAAKRLADGRLSVRDARGAQVRARALRRRTRSNAVLSLYAASLPSKASAAAWVAAITFVALWLPLLGAASMYDEDAFRYNLYSGNVATGFLRSTPIVRGADTVWPQPGTDAAALVNADASMTAMAVYNVWVSPTERRLFAAAAAACASCPDPSHPLDVSWLPKLDLLTTPAAARDRTPEVTRRSCRAWVEMYGC